MPGITINDLENAKEDVDHIAALATSSAMTATDRLGNVKPTLTAAIYSLMGFTSRGAWATATAYAIKDLVQQSGTWYVAVAAHTSAASFATDLASKWRVFQGVTAADLAAASASLSLGHDPRFAGEPTTTVGDALRRFEGADQLMAGLMASMAAGETVNIAVFGDSTVDGNDTTGWVANPVDGSGNAVGSAAHVPPNGWTTKMEPILRAMHKNNNINIWNAGYSGKALSDGWALANYDAAVTNNPAYGTPKAGLIDFGLNDIARVGLTFQDHAIQTRLLVAKLMLAGTIPILLSCDAHARNDADLRDNKESRRQIDQIKRAIAADFRIPFIDIGEVQRRWLSGNRDGQRWGALQPDGLHGADTWKAFTGSAMACFFFPDVYRVRPGQSERLTTQDSRSNNVGKWDDVSALSNIAQGRNNFYSSAAPTSTAMLTAWVFNESPDTEVIYRGIASERYSSAGMVNSPKTRITNMITDVATDRVPCGVGFIDDGTSASFSKSDLPYRLGHLSYGLNKIEYISGDDADDLWYGNFEFWQTPRELGLNGIGRTNPLKLLGVLQQDFTATGQQSLLVPEFRDGSNVYGLMGSDTVEILMDVTMAQGAGFIFGSCQTWNGSAVFGDRAFGMLYRHTDNSVRIYGGNVIGGVTTRLGLIASSSVVTWTSNRATLRLVMHRVSDEQVVNVYSGRSGGSAILTTTRAISTTSFPWAGAVGGFFWDGSVAGAGTAIAHEVGLRRY